MKLNNKGFAITGILYTLFILFLLILVSVLGGISLKRNMLQQSIIGQEDSFTGEPLTRDEIQVIIDDPLKIAPISGKYIFSIDGLETKCFAYLKEGISLNNESIIYTPSICNDNYNQTMTLEEVYKFERE